MTENEIDAFLKRAERLAYQNPVKTVDYLLLCKEGAQLANKHPEAGPQIGEWIVSAGSGTNLNMIFSYAPDLEYPSREKDWKRIEVLVDSTLKELSDN